MKRYKRSSSWILREDPSSKLPLLIRSKNGALDLTEVFSTDETTRVLWEFLEQTRSARELESQLPAEALTSLKLLLSMKAVHCL